MPRCDRRGSVDAENSGWSALPSSALRVQVGRLRMRGRTGGSAISSMMECLTDNVNKRGSERDSRSIDLIQLFCWRGLVDSGTWPDELRKRTLRGIRVSVHRGQGYIFLEWNP